MSSGLPRTFRPADGTPRPRVFDPALKQYPSAFRPGDPAFATPDMAAWWQDARRRATDHVLTAIAESQWADRLVLRGSRLLKAWLGAAAREPGDLDYVARPAAVTPTDPWAVGLLTGLPAVVAARPNPANIVFLPAAVATDEIWTYERAEGRRIVFPWQAVGLPGGAVQVDIVFGEDLTDPPALTPIPTADGDTAAVWAAGAGQSLAWKLLWLDTDSYPQGKDLYDAVLLAERVFLPRAMLERTLRDGRGGERGQMFDAQAALISDWTVDWDNFLREYPWATGDAATWKARLTTALAPTYATCAQPAQSVLFDPAWLTPDVSGILQGIVETRAFDRLPILADALEEAGCAIGDVLGHCRANAPHNGSCWVTAALAGLERL